MTYLTFDKAKYKLENYPMDVYHYFNSKILFDKHNQLTDLIEMAKRKYNLYCTPIDEKKQIKHWLMLASIKLKSANLSDDSLKVNYIVATNSWKLIEAVWAVNNKPVPPAGSVSRFLGKLNYKPFDGWFNKLFSSDFQLRYDSYVKISNWAINNLEVLL